MEGDRKRGREGVKGWRERKREGRKGVRRRGMEGDRKEGWRREMKGEI